MGDAQHNRKPDVVVTVVRVECRCGRPRARCRVVVPRPAANHTALTRHPNRFSVFRTRSGTIPTHCRSCREPQPAMRRVGTGPPPWCGSARFQRCWPFPDPNPVPMGTRWLYLRRWRPAATPIRWAAGLHIPTSPSASGRRPLRPTRTRSRPDGCPAGGIARLAHPLVLPALPTSVYSGSRRRPRESPVLDPGHRVLGNDKTAQPKRCQPYLKGDFSRPGPRTRQYPATRLPRRPTPGRGSPISDRRSPILTRCWWVVAGSSISVRRRSLSGRINSCSERD